MYIEQGYRGNLGMWKYFIIPSLFFGLIVLSFLLSSLIELDMQAEMARQVAQKGATKFLAESLMQFAVMLLLLLSWVKWVHPQSITALTTSRQSIDWGRIGFAFALWGGLTVVFTLVDVYFSPDNYVFNFNWEKFVPLAIVAILLIPFQTSFEEYFFRGYLFQGLGIITKHRWIPLVITSVLFGLMHFANPEVEKLGPGIMVYYIGTGFFLGIITLMDEGLELALGFHAANNLITALLVTADWTAFQTDSIYRDISEPNLGLDAFIPVFVLFPILLFIFAKKYHWGNWKEKLAGRVMQKVAFLASENAGTPTI
ncbi:MAG: CPBP family intramembrane glutamic endopeptidase [Bacteroidota bacterium]